MQVDVWVYIGSYASSKHVTTKKNTIEKTHKT